ncbi:Fructokinase [Paenibacillus sp. S02]|nr:PfkB family carbohydrate kinase [Paenibacillus sp. S02]QYK67508.1 Fructokinase [Paenibacillus sp. S02]
MMDEPFRQTYFDAMEDAVKHDCFVSFDPNYRVDLWLERVEEFIVFSKRGIAISDLVKVSEEELQLITGITVREIAVVSLHQWGAKHVAVTLGKAGTYISDGVNAVQVPSYPVRSIDSTDAGDAFVGALLYQISMLNNARN